MHTICSLLLLSHLRHRSYCLSLFQLAEHKSDWWYLMSLPCDAAAWNSGGGQEVNIIIIIYLFYLLLFFLQALMMPMFCIVYGCSSQSQWETSKGLPKIVVLKRENCKRLLQKCILFLRWNLWQWLNNKFDGHMCLLISLFLKFLFHLYLKKKKISFDWQDWQHTIKQRCNSHIRMIKNDKMHIFQDKCHSHISSKTPGKITSYNSTLYLLSLDNITWFSKDLKTRSYSSFSPQ